MAEVNTLMAGLSASQRSTDASGTGRISSDRTFVSSRIIRRRMVVPASLRGEQPEAPRLPAARNGPGSMQRDCQAEWAPDQGPNAGYRELRLPWTGHALPPASASGISDLRQDCEW